VFGNVLKNLFWSNRFVQCEANIICFVLTWIF